MATILLNTNRKFASRVVESFKALYNGEERLGCDEVCPDDCGIDHGYIPPTEEISKIWSKWGE